MGDLKSNFFCFCFVSMVTHRRKITVFSATLAALTIDHDGKESSGPEIHLSFHDNDHYNSVRDENIQVKPPPRKNKPTQQKKKQAKGKQKGAAACDTTVGDDSVPKEAERTSSGKSEVGMYVECLETPEDIQAQQQLLPARFQRNLINQ